MNDEPNGGEPIEEREHDFWERYERFRERHPPDPDLDPDEIFSERTESPGRTFRW